MLSSPASFFRVSRKVPRCLPLLLCPCFGSHSITLPAGSSACRLQCPTRPIFLAATLSPTSGRLSYSSEFGTCCHHGLLLRHYVRVTQYSGLHFRSQVYPSIVAVDTVHCSQLLPRRCAPSWPKPPSQTQTLWIFMVLRRRGAPVRTQQWDVMVSLPDRNSWLVAKRPAIGFTLGHHNVKLGTTILKRDVVRYFKPSGRRSLVSQTDGRTALR